MARRKAKRKSGRARRKTSAHFVLKTEAFCKCSTPKGTLGVLKRRLQTACKVDKHAYIVDTKATGAAARIVARCGGAS